MPPIVGLMRYQNTARIEGRGTKKMSNVYSETVRLRAPKGLLERAREKAQDEEVTLSELIRNALRYSVDGQAQVGAR